MKRRNIWHAGVGIAYGTLVCLLSLLLIRNLPSVLALFSGLFGMDAKTTDHISRALAQLGNNPIGSPWVIMLLFGGCVGWLLSLIPGRKGIWINSILAVFLLLPLILAAVWFTYINGILVGDLAMSLLQWL